jgi:dTDP-4-dehydrorhamnose reductase
MRLLVTGAGGMTGAKVNAQSVQRGWECRALTRAELDISDSEAVREAIASYRPDVVINAAAYTAVDDAEQHEALATRVNADGAGNVARAANESGAAVIHISTDYVFDGKSSRPHLPTDPVGPLGAYGRSKLAGEIAVRTEAERHLIVRTSWVYSEKGRNFVLTMLRIGATTREIKVVNDQHGCPTSASDLALALLAAADSMNRDRGMSGTYHFSNSGVTTWYDFAKEIFHVRGGVAPVIIPIPSASYPTPAKRPSWSVLDCSSFARDFGVSPRPWQEALRDVLGRTQ